MVGRASVLYFVCTVICMDGVKKVISLQQGRHSVIHHAATVQPLDLSLTPGGSLEADSQTLSVSLPLCLSVSLFFRCDRYQKRPRQVFS